MTSKKKTVSVNSIKLRKPDNWIPCPGLEMLTEEYGIEFYVERAMKKTVQNFFDMIGPITFDFTPNPSGYISPQELSARSLRKKPRPSYREKSLDLILNGTYNKKQAKVYLVPCKLSYLSLKPTEYSYFFRIHEGILILDFICSSELYAKISACGGK